MAETSSSARSPTDLETSIDVPHAFHQNLPSHHKDSDGIPYITKFAAKKARGMVDLIYSIQIMEEMFNNSEEDDEMLDDDNSLNGPEMNVGDDEQETLASITKKCTRLQSQLASLGQLKYRGIAQREWCEIVLHLLRLLTATVYREILPDGETKTSLNFESIGYIFSGDDMDSEESWAGPRTTEDLELELTRRFALPTTAREIILSVLIHILSNKGPLRGASNSSIYLEGEAVGSRFLMILHWRVLFVALLRTAPHLDEHKVMGAALDSSSRYNTVVKRTVQLIRDARHFFDQGLRPGGTAVTDKTAKELWEMVQTDVLFHAHTHACYRGTILLYLFLPSRCSQDFYLSVMPQWHQAWTNIDRCPEFDFLWLALFCRARKHISSEIYDWTPLRRRLLTHTSYWLHLPIGGVGDKSFPRASNPRSRSCPPRLKIFVGSGTAYDEGIDFFAKITKLLVVSLGTGPQIQSGSKPFSEGTYDMLRFLSYVAPYFNPSNIGGWTFSLGAFLHYFSYELCRRVGAQGGFDVVSETNPNLAKEMQSSFPGSNAGPIPPHELVAILDACMPLCQQALYSKNGHVGRAAEAAMMYLVQIDPKSTPSLLDFATEALDVSAVSLAHQAPSALSALSRLIQPSLRHDPAAFLSRLPQILRLTLAGIDSNDQNKTIRTLIFYRSLTSWVPIGGKLASLLKPLGSAEVEEGDGIVRFGANLADALAKRRNSADYLAAVASLSDVSLFKNRENLVTNRYVEADDLVIEEALLAMSDWALEFLDRVFGLLRNSGEREKAGKSSSGMASRYTSADVNQARNFSRVLKECLLQVFSSIDAEGHALLIRSVVRFIEEETLPAAGKDASLLCQAVAAVRETNGIQVSPGLDALVPILCDDIAHHSTKTCIYRIRCLAGAVRRAGLHILKHRDAISEALDVCLGSDDRHLFKTGCKLLRHTLAALCESYTMSTDLKARVYADANGRPVFGRSSEVKSDPVNWYIPTNECIEFAISLLRKHVSTNLDGIYANDSTNDSPSMLITWENARLRRILRVIRYSIRGGATLLLDNDSSGRDSVPYEQSVNHLLSTVGPELMQYLCSLRGRISGFLIAIMSIIASECLHPGSGGESFQESPIRKSFALISQDVKICKEAGDIALLMLTRRGPSFRSQELKTILKAQKQLFIDHGLSSLVDYLSAAMERANVHLNRYNRSYKDGEDAGKTLPRRLLASRIQIYHDSLQRHASFEIPRSLRNCEREENQAKVILFRAQGGFDEFVVHVKSLLAGSTQRPLDLYEGIVDGLFALSCHSNTRVRASSVSVIDYALTRFGWFGPPRVLRLFAGIRLEDAGSNGKFGLPSCATLKNVLDQQGKRKKLSESIKGVCSIVSLPKMMKFILGSEKLRLHFTRASLETDELLSMMPTEELQKMVLYLQTVFAPFRSRIYWLPRSSNQEKRQHVDAVELSLKVLREKDPEKKEDAEDGSDSRAAHWKKLLMAGWFLQTSVDEDDMNNSLLSREVWTTCFHLLESQKGQPLQRVALGLLGKIVVLSRDLSTLDAQFNVPGFCETFSNALVFDHREDSSMNGGHEAQWSSGVEDILRDSARHVSPRNLFPFQRTSQSTGSFKVSHCQLIESILRRVEKDTAKKVWDNLLVIARSLAEAPPSEDQRNQHITSAEIFAGVCGAYLRGSVVTDAWEGTLLKHLNDAMGKIPFSLSGSYFDAIRYSLQFTSPSSFYPLTLWLVSKIERTLWQPSTSSDDTNSNPDSAAPNSEGFTEQSKWLYLLSALLIELDETVSVGSLPSNFLGCPINATLPDRECLSDSWRLVSGDLLTRLLNAIGHPFESCRDHISRCLFRICYYHRKNMRVSASRGPSRSNSTVDLASAPVPNPGSMIVAKLRSLNKTDLALTEKYNSLTTARRFISYCVQLGEAKAEYSEYVIPLLPLVFESLSVAREESEAKMNPELSAEDSTAKRALETEVTKQFRFAVAEISVTAVVSYGSKTDLGRVLSAVRAASTNPTWQVRHACANFLRCFQGGHKYLLSPEHDTTCLDIVVTMLTDDRREVSDASMAALTGILAASPVAKVSALVKKQSLIANKSRMKKKKKSGSAQSGLEQDPEQEKERAKNQQSSVFFLCASVMAQPYDTPPYVPVALAAISKHSFERSAPLNVRETVKKCCAEYKKTHMCDNWAIHKRVFSEAQLDALEDVVSSPHYYA